VALTETKIAHDTAAGWALCCLDVRVRQIRAHRIMESRAHARWVECSKLKQEGTKGRHRKEARRSLKTFREGPSVDITSGP